jgi:hypothetical protein
MLDAVETHIFGPGRVSEMVPLSPMMVITITEIPTLLLVWDNETQDYVDDGNESTDESKNANSNTGMGLTIFSKFL